MDVTWWHTMSPRYIQHQQEAQRVTSCAYIQCNLFEESTRVAIFVYRLAQKHKLGKGRWDLASCQVLLNSVQQLLRRSRKYLSQSDARAAILFLRSAQKHKLCRGLRSCFLSSSLNPVWPKNTNLVRDLEILVPVKFCWIPFSSFGGEVKNISANQRPGRPSCFSDRPEKHKLGRGCWYLASCQISSNSL